MIAFDTNGLIYEGESFCGYGLWPSPVVTIATLVTGEDTFLNIFVSDDLMRAKLVFREDFFDPVTRIRRGRFYINHGAQPSPWHVHPHSFLPSQALEKRDLITYQRWRDGNSLRLGESLVALGTADAYTIWSVVDVERISTGDDLITIRARNSLGRLPRVMSEMIPERGRQQVSSLLEKVVNAAYRAGPESVIDRCRDASQACIGLWFTENGGPESAPTVDLSQLLDLVEKHFLSNPPVVMLSAGRIVARLHARKPNEQIKRSLRGNVEGDAEVALANVGLLLRELGWARD